MAGLRSSTIWTSAHDLENKVFYYHTQHNRQVRKVDVGSLNFGAIKEVQTFPLDERKKQAIKRSCPTVINQQGLHLWIERRLRRRSDFPNSLDFSGWL
jgi:hypothetical protein